MGQVRVIFDAPQNFGGVLVNELTVDADRLVLMNGRDVLVDVPAGNVRAVDRGAEARTARLRSAHRNHGRAWTAQEESDLRRMWAEGVAMPALVNYFGRSRNAVGSAVRRLNLPPRDGEQSVGTWGADGAG